MMHLRQSLKITAYEGARVGVVPEASSVNVEFQCSSLLDGRNIKGYSIALVPTNPAALNEGDFFEVAISADYAANSLLGSWFFADKTVTQSCALRRN